MITDLEAQALRHRVLPLFDTAFHELFDATAVNTDDVVVMRAMVELEHGHATLEMVARDEAGGFELRQNPVYRGKADILVGYQQLLVDILGAQVARRAVRENVEDFQPRQRDFEAGIAQVVAFVGGRWLEALRHAVQLGMIRLRLSII